VRGGLMLGALRRRSAGDAAAVGADLGIALALFPALAGKLDLPAGALSGGQQQMLAVARGLMAKPRVLLLDEPSLGLAPILVREIFAAIERLRAQGVTVLLVEQMAAQALALADRAYVLDRGRIHSVFERAVNVLWGDGHLLTLHGPGPLAAPFAIALERLPARDAVVPGMTIGHSDFGWADAERVALEMPGGALGFGREALPEPTCARALYSAAGLRAREALERGITLGDAGAF